MGTTSSKSLCEPGVCCSGAGRKTANFGLSNKPKASSKFDLPDKNLPVEQANGVDGGPTEWMPGLQRVTHTQVPHTESHVRKDRNMFEDMAPVQLAMEAKALQRKAEQYEEAESECLAGQHEHLSEHTHKTLSQEVASPHRHHHDRHGKRCHYDSKMATSFNPPRHVDLA